MHFSLRRWTQVWAVAVTVAACSPSPQSNTNAVKVLVDRESVFPAVLDLIASAQREILFSMYLFGGAEATASAPAGIGRQIVDALVERHRAGVRVRVINTRFVRVEDRRKSVGPDDDWFNPVFDYAVEQGLPIIRPAPKPGAIDHTKYLIVDGREAIFGGMNLADAVASNHDVMVHVAGPAVGELQRLFQRSWDAAVAAAKEKGPRNPITGPAVELTGPSELAAAAEAKRAAGWPASCTTEIRATTPDTKEILPLLRETLDSAKPGDSLRISLLLFSERSLMDAVIAAHKRGVAVRVILDPNEAFYGVDCRGSLNAQTMLTLADAGVDVRHYAVKPGQEMHMKVFVLERSGGERIFGVGSANWTGSDMHKNWEVFGLFSNCEQPAAELVELFEADWNTRTRALTPELLATYRDEAERQKLSKACGALLKTDAWLRGKR